MFKIYGANLVNVSFVMRKTHKKINHKRITGKSQANYRKITNESQENHKRIIGKSQANYRKITNELQVNHKRII